MHGKTPTKAEREHWDKVARLGCIACLKDGRVNDFVSIHHVDGRTKPGSHMRVLPYVGRIISTTTPILLEGLACIRTKQGLKLSTAGKSSY